MPIVIEDTANIADGGTYTPAAGTNRVVVVSISAKSWSSAHVITSITFGGVDMQLGYFVNAPLGCFLVNYYLDEAQIAGLPGGPQTFSITWSAAIDELGYGTIYTLSGVSQSDPVRTSGVMFSEYDVNTDPWETNWTSLDEELGIALVSQAQNALPDPDPNYTVRRRAWSGAVSHCSQDRMFATGQADAFTTSWASFGRRGGQMVVPYQAAGAEPTLSLAALLSANQQVK